MALTNIRRKIDLIDSKLLKLLNERMEQAIIARKFKAKIEDTGREKEILKKIERDTGELVSPEFCKTIFAEIITESKKLQKKDYGIIAFQGEHGAYSEMASKAWNNDLISIPCNTFDEVFKGVAQGSFEYGIVPVENTLGGVVGQVNDNLMRTDLHVVGAIEHPISHCLLTLPGTDHREIRRVYSHIQALQQCKHFLDRNNLEPIPYYDTAGAAKMLTEKMPDGTAVIASKFAAVLYNLDILKSGIEDLHTNKTRFLILSKNKIDTKGNKCSIMFSTEHKAGTLFNVLNYFAEAGLNLSRIESMPKEPGNYAFFLDFMGSENDAKVQEVLEKTEKNTSGFRFMGCYNEREIS